MKYKMVSIASVSKRITSGGTPKSIKNEYYQNGTIPWLNTKEVHFNRITKTEKFITELGLENSSAKWIEAPAVIVAMYGATAGNVAISEIPLTTNQACCNIIIDNEKADYRYIYYYLKLNYQQLAGLANGGAQQNLNAQQIKDFIIPLPTLNEQIQIASILSTIDDRIDYNQRINDNLLQQAQALFKEWFIKTQQGCDTHETELGLLPDGFSVIKTGELPMIVTDYVANGSFASLKENVQLYQERNYAYFIRNTDLKVGTFEVFVDEHSYNFLTKSRLFGGEIIISNVGDVGSVFLCPKLDAPMTLGNNIIMLKPLQDDLRYYLYIWFKWSMGQGLMQGIKGGSAQPKFNKTDFKSLPIILPPEELLRRFHETVCPIFDAVENNQSENRHLVALRDALLPKLMSGEIDVSDVQI